MQFFSFQIERKQTQQNIEFDIFQVKATTSLQFDSVIFHQNDIQLLWKNVTLTSTNVIFR